MIGIYAAGALVVLIILFVLINRGGDDETEQTESTSSETESPSPSPAPSMRGGVMQRENWLVGRAGNVEGKTFHIGTRTVTIGRKPTNFIQIDDTEVSRVHCQLMSIDGGLDIRDMESTLGTKVNGKKIEPDTPVRLSTNDTIEVGSAKFVYYRMGDFHENHGLTEQKGRGEQYEAATEVKGGAQWKQAIEDELNRANGNPQKAAENMGIEVEVFLQMMKQAGVGRD